MKKLLLPVSWLYGLGVRVRNLLFDAGVLKSRVFDTPTICVGNLTVGGTGKTPHVEYLIRLLSPSYKVAVLSRGYKRKTKGYVLADRQSTALDIGDEPCQMKTKFPSLTVAVCEDRCEGIRQIETDKRTRQTKVILLDDAYQHRYVKASLTILLMDYHRPIYTDYLLPAGQLREPWNGRRRADIVIVTKCPPSLSEAERSRISRSLHLEPSQSLFFSTMAYHDLKPLYCGADKPLDHLCSDDHILLVTGIARPLPLVEMLQSHTPHVSCLNYPDHHHFTDKDISDINDIFSSLPSPKIVVTTEKDAARLQNVGGLSEEVRHHLFEVPIEVKFLFGEGSAFDEKVIPLPNLTPHPNPPQRGGDLDEEMASAKPKLT